MAMVEQIAVLYALLLIGGLSVGWGRRPLLTRLALLSVLSGCEAGQNVGAHHFIIPDKHVLSLGEWPFFLDRAEAAGFTFTLNPSAPLREQVSVGVQTTEDVCARAAGSRASVNATVCSRGAFNWEGQRLHRSGDATFWAYTLVKGSTSADPQVVASCYAINAAARGLCTAVVPFDDLILTIGLADTDMSHLGSIYQQATALLQQWERQSARSSR